MVPLNVAEFKQYVQFRLWDNDQWGVALESCNDYFAK